MQLNQQVYGVLFGAIEDGLLDDGTLLREGPLMKFLGASRAPVRQALGRLRAEGVLQRVAGGGHVVGGGPGPFRQADLQALLAGRARGDGQIRKAPAWEQIYEEVERAVIHRSAFGSARINEFELARHFDVGRLVARDVLTRLEMLGMLEKDARQRWSIVALDALRVTHLNEMREQLEPLALRQSCQGLSRDQLETMRARLTLQIERYPRVDAARMNALENDLHVTCLAGCPNKELLDALRRTHCVLTLSKHVLGVEMPLPDSDPFLVEHLAVFDKLLEGDVPGAAIGLVSHLKSATPKIIRRLETFRSEYRPRELPFVMTRSG